MEHCGQRVTECFLRPIQEVVLQTGDSNGKVSETIAKKAVTKMNAIWKRHSAHYRIKPKKDGGWYVRNNFTHIVV
jgi:hypothetical protein